MKYFRCLYLFISKILLSDERRNEMQIFFDDEISSEEINLLNEIGIFALISLLPRVIIVYRLLISMLWG